MLWEELKAQNDADDRRYDALPLYRKAAEDAVWWVRYGIRNMYRDARFAIRVRFNRALRGYDESDWWEYYSNASARAVTLLPYLKGRGCPGSFLGSFDYTEEDADAAHARWDACLDDMVFFHRVCAGETKDRLELSDDDKHRYPARQVLLLQVLRKPVGLKCLIR